MNAERKRIMAALLLRTRQKLLNYDRPLILVERSILFVIFFLFRTGRRRSLFSYLQWSNQDFALMFFLRKRSRPLNNVEIRGRRLRGRVIAFRALFPCASLSDLKESLVNYPRNKIQVHVLFYLLPRQIYEDILS